MLPLRYYVLIIHEYLCEPKQNIIGQDLLQYVRLDLETLSVSANKLNSGDVSTEVCVQCSMISLF